MTLPEALEKVIVASFCPTSPPAEPTPPVTVTFAVEWSTEPSFCPTSPPSLLSTVAFAGATVPVALALKMVPPLPLVPTSAPPLLWAPPTVTVAFANTCPGDVPVIVPKLLPTKPPKLPNVPVTIAVAFESRTVAPLKFAPTSPPRLTDRVPGTLSAPVPVPLTVPVL